MTPHKRIASLFAVAVGLVSLITPSYAEMDGVCREDMQKFCSDVKPGDGRLKDCMHDHHTELSPACKHTMAEAKEKHMDKREDVMEACKPDLQQFCANVTPGEGREFSCLKAYEDKLSPACKEKLPKRGMHKGKHRGGHKDK